MLQRARLVKTASQKISLAGEIILKNYKKGQKWIIYCDNQVQLRDVLKLLLKNGIDAYEYHSEMQGDKNETLDYFSHFGGVLVSIRCLDEGIDIPSTTHALILASSKNPREFIQRRGRILRKAEGKNFAYLYDVVVTPNGEMQDDTKAASIIESELSRAIQFGEWAENPSCIAKLKNIAIDFGIDVIKSSTDGHEGGDDE
jgi:superfamily II DNA or RNA helicase